MTEQRGAEPAGAAAGSQPGLNPLGTVAVAVLAGAALFWAAKTSSAAVLAVVAAAQAALGAAWVFGTGMPGRRGGLVLIAVAAAGADVTVARWPHGQLGTLLVVFALAVPAMFVHQLARGAVRARVVASLGSTTLAVAAVVALAALVQLRHGFQVVATGATVTAAVAAIAAGSLVVGHFVDLIHAAPRFDAQVPRGLFAALASAGLGGSLGHLMLPARDFGVGRGTFIGAALGALIAFFAVAVAFVQVTAPQPGRAASWTRPVLGALLPLSLLAPVAFLLCLAVRV